MSNLLYAASLVASVWSESLVFSCVTKYILINPPILTCFFEFQRIEMPLFEIICFDGPVPLKQTPNTLLLKCGKVVVFGQDVICFLSNLRR